MEGIKEGSEYVVWQNAIRALGIARVTGSGAIGIERQLVIDFDVNNIFKFIDDLFLQLITIKA